MDGDQIEKYTESPIKIWGNFMVMIIKIVNSYRT